MHTRSTIVVSAILASLLAVSCGKREEREFEEVLAGAGSGKVSAAALAAALVNLATEERFGDGAVATGGAVMIPGSETLRVKWPRNISLEPGKGFDEGVFNAATGDSVFTDGKELVLFGPDGGRLAVVTAPGEGRVTGLHPGTEVVYFLQGGVLYGVPRGKEPVKVVEGAVLAPPKLGIAPRTTTVKSGDFLAVNCGHAGVYSLSVVDLKSKKAAVKDFANASSAFGLSEGTLACITGATGKWSLVGYDLGTKTKVPVRSFTSLRDASFAGEYAALTDETGVIVAHVRSKKLLRVPFEIGIAGSAGDRFLVSWEKEKRLVDPKAFFQGLERISAAAPSLFAPSK